MPMPIGPLLLVCVAIHLFDRSLLQLDISSNNIPSNLIQQIRDEHPAVTVLE
jgi:hypothetical protein